MILMIGVKKCVLKFRSGKDVIGFSSRRSCHVVTDEVLSAQGLAPAVQQIVREGLRALPFRLYWLNVDTQERLSASRFLLY